MTLTTRQQAYVDAIVEHADALGIDCTKDTYTRAELRQVSMAAKGKIWIPNWITHDQSRRVGRGTFNLSEVREAYAANSMIESAVDSIVGAEPELVGA